MLSCKRIKGLLCFLLALSVLVTPAICPTAASAVPDIEALRAEFQPGKGPETNGFSIDYEYFTPDKSDAEAKYPLVIWLHGMGDGSEPGAQIQKSSFAFWASDSFQARFKNAGGAYLLAARSLEENKMYWSGNLIVPLKAAIDDFISKHDDIDLTRIYIGGYSMGGKMTIHMACSYPDFFAAAFPLCPAYVPNAEQLALLKDMPIWLVASEYDVLAGYHTYTSDIWDILKDITNIPESCRLSKMGRVCFPDGQYTTSNHWVWYAVSYDMFTYEGGSYYNTVTVDARNIPLILTYPDGMISWLSSFTSDYNGETLEPSGAIDFSEASITRKNVLPMLKSVQKILFIWLSSVFFKIK